MNAALRAAMQYNKDKLIFFYTGNGSATFDPAITTSKSTTCIWQTSDGQTAITTGTSHAFSYTPASGGPYRCVVRVAGGLGLVTALSVVSDAITYSQNMKKLTSLIDVDLSYNSLSCLVSDARASRQFYTRSCTGLVGSLADIARTVTAIQADGCTYLIGLLSDIPSGVTQALLNGSSCSPASIGHLTAIRDIRLYSMWPSLAAADSVDIVINSMWAARAAYAYASGPSMQIGGTNPDPTGNIVAPVEGADWHEDTPGHWVPLTPGAKIYDLLNDVNSEGFNTWTAITIT